MCEKEKLKNITQEGKNVIIGKKPYLIQPGGKAPG